MGRARNTRRVKDLKKQKEMGSWPATRLGRIGYPSQENLEKGGKEVGSNLPQG